MLTLSYNNFHVGVASIKRDGKLIYIKSEDDASRNIIQNRRYEWELKTCESVLVTTIAERNQVEKYSEASSDNLPVQNCPPELVSSHSQLSLCNNSGVSMPMRKIKLIWWLSGINEGWICSLEVTSIIVGAGFTFLHSKLILPIFFLLDWISDQMLEKGWLSIFQRKSSMERRTV